MSKRRSARGASQMRGDLMLEAVPPSSPPGHCNETSADLQGLLVEQRLAVERALTLNQALVDRLDCHCRHGVASCSELAFEPVPETLPAAPRLSLGVSPQSAGLAEPLLSRFPQDKDGRPRSPVLSERTDRSTPQSRQNQQGAQALPDVEELKKLVDTFSRREYRVEDLYHDSGCAQRLAQSSSFSVLTLVMIVLNTFWIGVDVDLNKAELLCDAPAEFQIVNNAFCFFFSFEILIRFASFRQKRDAFRDTWFVFDFWLVMLLVWETWVEVLIFLLSSHNDVVPSMHSTSVFRVLRLVRLTRMARLLHSMPEFMILVNGMVLAVRSVSATLALVFLIIYIYAVLFVQLLSGEDSIKDIFGNIPLAMSTLFEQIVCGFEKDIFDRLLALGFIYYVLYSLFFLLGYMTMTNMLIGVLCEVVSAESQTQKEESFAMEVQEQIGAIMREIDVNGDNSVSKAEFSDLMNHPDTIRSLADLGIDVVALFDFVALAFNECEEMPTDDLMQIFIQFRGARSVTVKDIFGMRKFLSKEMEHLERRLSVSSHFARFEARLPDLLTPRLVGS